MILNQAGQMFVKLFHCRYECSGKAMHCNLCLKKMQWIDIQGNFAIYLKSSKGLFCDYV